MTTDIPAILAPLDLDDELLDPLAPLRRYQQGRCAVCEETRPLAVDHDHVTQLVRGLLCNGCNTSEGAQKYPWLRAYRADPPAARIGLQVLFGQHRPKKARPPKVERLSSWEKLAVAAAERPDWSPTLPADPEMAAGVLQFWGMFRALGEAIIEWRAEDQAEAAK